MISLHRDCSSLGLGLGLGLGCSGLGLGLGLALCGLVNIPGLSNAANTMCPSDCWSVCLMPLGQMVHFMAMVIIDH